MTDVGGAAEDEDAHNAFSEKPAVTARLCSHQCRDRQDFIPFCVQAEPPPPQTRFERSQKLHGTNTKSKDLV
jgi:hypothetical protein